MSDLAPSIALVFALAVIVKYLVDVIARPLVAYYKLPSQWLAVLALIFGEAFAFGLVVPLVDTGLAPWASQAATGVLIGGGAGLVHDFLKAIGYSVSQ